MKGVGGMELLHEKVVFEPDFEKFDNLKEKSLFQEEWKVHAKG